MRTLINNKLVEIHNIIADRKNNSHYGLLGGSLGEVLFLFYFGELIRKENVAVIATQRLEDTIKTINSSKNVLFSFGNGISGLLWVMYHLNKCSYLTFDINNFNKYDRLIKETMNDKLTIGLYDYLHESLGMYLMFLSRNDNDPEILDFVCKMDTIKINCDLNMGIGWEYYLRSADRMVINLGMSHGLSSIIAILSKGYKVNSNSLTKELIIESIKCLLSAKSSTQNNSIFPNHVFKNAKPISNKSSESRLAWCYGDLGISVALWHASQALGRKDWEQEAIDTILHASKRRGLVENGVVDAGLCHGTAGIAHIFNRMYGYTGLEELKEASNYWFAETLKMARFEDGLAGFKAWQGNERGRENEPGLLEGIAGIGLARISAVSDIEPAWDECLLLS